MEEEEESKFCSCCKKYVNASNFTSHSAFCQRNITICRICKEPVLKDFIKEHEEKFHITVICDLCYASVKKFMLSKHQEECPMRSVFCEFCRKNLPFNTFANHIEFCESRTEQCSKCSKYIMLKDKKKHSELHAHEKPICSENSGGKKDLNALDELIDKTSKKFLAYGVKPWGKTSGSPGKNDPVTDDFANCAAAAVCVPEKSKQECSNYTRCYICNLYISWEEYDLHKKNCNTPFEKCPYCDEYVSVFSFQQHVCSDIWIVKDSNAQGNQSESKIGACKSLSGSASTFYLPGKRGESDILCPFCDLPVFPIDMLEHVKSCLKGPFFHNDRSGHVKSCPESYFQCHLCYENVLQTDRDMHLSSKCKMLQEQIPSDSYTCPLCNETFKLEERVIHDFFKCKALIETNKESLFLMPYDEFSNNTYEETEDDSDVLTNLKPKAESKNGMIPSLFKNSLSEPSKYYRPMAKQKYDMFGFPDVPPYSYTSSKSSGYGGIASSSKLKEHAQEEFSKIPQKKRECDRSPDNFNARAKSFEKVLRSLTTNFCNERKLLEQSQNARMGTSRSEKKHCSDSNEFSKSLKSKPYKMKLDDYPIFNCGIQSTPGGEKSTSSSTMGSKCDYPIFKSAVPSSSSQASQSTSGGENSTLSSNMESKSNTSEAKSSPDYGALWSPAVQLPRCIICTMNERNIVFQPCGHLVICSSCSNSRMTDCPVCRKRIRHKLKTYIS